MPRLWKTRDEEKDGVVEHKAQETDSEHGLDAGKPAQERSVGAAGDPPVAPFVLQQYAHMVPGLDGSPLSASPLEQHAPMALLGLDGSPLASPFGADEGAAVAGLQQAFSSLIKAAEQKRVVLGTTTEPVFVLEYRHTTRDFAPHVMLKAAHALPWPCAAPLHESFGPVILVHGEHERVKQAAQGLHPRHVVVAESLLGAVDEAVRTFRPGRGRKVNLKAWSRLDF